MTYFADLKWPGEGMYLLTKKISELVCERHWYCHLRWLLCPTSQMSWRLGSIQKTRVSHVETGILNIIYLSLAPSISLSFYVHTFMCINVSIGTYACSDECIQATYSRWGSSCLANKPRSVIWFYPHTKLSDTNALAELSQSLYRHVDWLGLTNRLFRVQLPRNFNFNLF